MDYFTVASNGREHASESAIAASTGMVVGHPGELSAFDSPYVNVTIENCWRSSSIMG
jgi:hypothetical protein